MLRNRNGVTGNSRHALFQRQFVVRPAVSALFTSNYDKFDKRLRASKQGDSTFAHRLCR